MVSLESDGLGAGEIKRRPEVEVLLMTRNDRTEVMKGVPAGGREGGTEAPAQKAAATLHIIGE